MSEETPTARDGRPGCPVTVWDGPYSTRCGAGASAGTCAHHGPFATTTPVTSAAETPEFTGAVSGLTLTSPGPGKVIWPDGSEVSAEQFQDSVTAATIAYEKGLAAGRQAALEEAASAEWQAQRLWRAVGPDGDLWAEASDEAEVRERARPGDTIQRFYVTEPRGEWRDA